MTKFLNVIKVMERTWTHNPKGILNNNFSRPLFLSNIFLYVFSQSLHSKAYQYFFWKYKRPVKVRQLCYNLNKDDTNQVKECNTDTEVTKEKLEKLNLRNEWTTPTVSVNTVNDIEKPALDSENRGLIGMTAPCKRRNSTSTKISAQIVDSSIQNNTQDFYHSSYVVESNRERRLPINKPKTLRKTIGNIEDENEKFYDRPDVENNEEKIVPLKPPPDRPTFEIPNKITLLPQPNRPDLILKDANILPPPPERPNLEKPLDDLKINLNRRQSEFNLQSTFFYKIPHNSKTMKKKLKPPPGKTLVKNLQESQFEKKNSTEWEVYNKIRQFNEQRDVSVEVKKTFLLKIQQHLKKIFKKKKIHPTLKKHKMEANCTNNPRKEFTKIKNNSVSKDISNTENSCIKVIYKEPLISAYNYIEEMKEKTRGILKSSSLMYLMNILAESSKIKSRSKEQPNTELNISKKYGPIKTDKRGSVDNSTILNNSGEAVNTSSVTSDKQVTQNTSLEIAENQSPNLNQSNITKLHNEEFCTSSSNLTPTSEIDNKQMKKNVFSNNCKTSSEINSTCKLCSSHFNDSNNSPLVLPQNKLYPKKLNKLQTLGINEQKCSGEAKKSENINNQTKEQDTMRNISLKSFSTTLFSSSIEVMIGPNSKIEHFMNNCKLKYSRGIASDSHLKAKSIHKIEPKESCASHIEEPVQNLIHKKTKKPYSTIHFCANEEKCIQPPYTLPIHHGIEVDIKEEFGQKTKECSVKDNNESISTNSTFNLQKFEQKNKSTTAHNMDASNNSRGMIQLLYTIPNVSVPNHSTSTGHTSNLPGVKQRNNKFTASQNINVPNLFHGMTQPPYTIPKVTDFIIPHDQPVVCPNIPKESENLAGDSKNKFLKHNLSLTTYSETKGSNDYPTPKEGSSNLEVNSSSNPQECLDTKSENSILLIQPSYSSPSFHDLPSQDVSSKKCGDMKSLFNNVLGLKKHHKRIQPATIQPSTNIESKKVIPRFCISKKSFKGGQSFHSFRCGYFSRPRIPEKPKQIIQPEYSLPPMNDLQEQANQTSKPILSTAELPKKNNSISMFNKSSKETNQEAVPFESCVQISPYSLPPYQFAEQCESNNSSEEIDKGTSMLSKRSVSNSELCKPTLNKTSVFEKDISKVMSATMDTKSGSEFPENSFYQHSSKINSDSILFYCAQFLSKVLNPWVPSNVKDSVITLNENFISDIQKSTEIESCKSNEVKKCHIVRFPIQSDHIFLNKVKNPDLSMKKTTSLSSKSGKNNKGDQLYGIKKCSEGEKTKNIPANLTKNTTFSNTKYTLKNWARSNEDIAMPKESTLAIKNQLETILKANLKKRSVNLKKGNNFSHVYARQNTVKKIKHSVHKSIAKPFKSRKLCVGSVSEISGNRPTIKYVKMKPLKIARNKAQITIPKADKLWQSATKNNANFSPMLHLPKVLHGNFNTDKISVPYTMRKKQSFCTEKVCKHAWNSIKARYISSFINNSLPKLIETTSGTRVVLPQPNERGKKSFNIQSLPKKYPLDVRDSKSDEISNFKKYLGITNLRSKRTKDLPLKHSSITDHVLKILEMEMISIYNSKEELLNKKLCYKKLSCGENNFYYILTKCMKTIKSESAAEDDRKMSMAILFQLLSKIQSKGPISRKKYYFGINFRNKFNNTSFTPPISKNCVGKSISINKCSNLSCQNASKDKNKKVPSTEPKLECSACPKKLKTFNVNNYKRDTVFFNEQMAINPFESELKLQEIKISDSKMNKDFCVATNPFESEPELGEFKTSDSKNNTVICNEQMTINPFKSGPELEKYKYLDSEKNTAFCNDTINPFEYGLELEELKNPEGEKNIYFCYDHINPFESGLELKRFKNLDSKRNTAFCNDNINPFESELELEEFKTPDGKKNTVFYNNYINPFEFELELDEHKSPDSKRNKTFGRERLAINPFESKQEHDELKTLTNQDENWKPVDIQIFDITITSPEETNEQKRQTQPLHKTENLAEISKNSIVEENDDDSIILLNFKDKSKPKPKCPHPRKPYCEHENCSVPSPCLPKGSYEGPPDVCPPLRPPQTSPSRPSNYPPPDCQRKKKASSSLQTVNTTPSKEELDEWATLSIQSYSDRQKFEYLNFELGNKGEQIKCNLLEDNGRKPLTYVPVKNSEGNHIVQSNIKSDMASKSKNFTPLSFCDQISQLQLPFNNLFNNKFTMPKKKFSNKFQQLNSQSSCSLNTQSYKKGNKVNHKKESIDFHPRLPSQGLDISINNYLNVRFNNQSSSSKEFSQKKKERTFEEALKIYRIRKILGKRFCMYKQNSKPQNLNAAEIHPSKYQYKKSAKMELERNNLLKACTNNALIEQNNIHKRNIFPIIMERFRQNTTSASNQSVKKMDRGKSQNVVYCKHQNLKFYKKFPFQFKNRNWVKCSFKTKTSYVLSPKQFGLQTRMVLKDRPKENYMIKSENYTPVHEFKKTTKPTMRYTL